MTIAVPEFSVIVLIGTSGSGKSTFSRQHFLPTEVLSSDAFRGIVCDDENRLDVSRPAFEALHYVLGKRLELGRLTVIDATNVQKESRAPILEIAETWHALKVAIIIDTPEELCRERNKARPDRQFGPHVIRRQHDDLRKTFGQLRGERFHRIYRLTPDQLGEVEIVRERLWSRQPEAHGPFDVIGDVHGCYDELMELVRKLGWSTAPTLSHPENRKLAFVGDLVDRGPKSVPVLKFVMAAVASGAALCVPGNHDIKLSRALKGAKVTTAHGLAETLRDLERETPEFRREVADFLESLTSHALLDDNKLCIAHAGMREEMQGRGSKAVREFALYGETTGETDEFGLPARYEWARDYRGKALVVYGHTPVLEPEWLNGTIDIDTGCCFGGRLTALRYPEKELVSVPAHHQYAESPRPLHPVETVHLSSQQAHDGLLNIQDVLGRRTIETRLAHRVTVPEENAIAALEVMSRFAADHRWLVHLPPTMSPAETSQLDGYLEYPTDALGYFARSGVTQVICEQKHMGSRAVAMVCRNAEAARKRFGIDTGEAGVIITRTGRRFFEDLTQEFQLLQRLNGALERAGAYAELESDWVILDLELMPWSAKAVGLLQQQYAPVGAAAEACARAWEEVSRKVAERGLEGGAGLVATADFRLDSAVRFRDAYRQYCWTVHGLEDFKLAPFHLLASENSVHVEKDHLWHMNLLGRICDEDPQILLRTPYHVVDPSTEAGQRTVCEWWEDLVARGGEGMVIKPLQFITHDGPRLVQPALKCRGPEYLRIIYGQEYLQPENLASLRHRSVNRKRSLAVREFALGVEALERFVRGEPLRNVHECVFGVLALESEPVDPRL